MKEKARFSIAFENCVEYKEELWFVSLGDTWLCKMSKKTYIAEKVCAIPHTEQIMYEYDVASAGNGKIIIMPLMKKIIFSYDIDNHKFEEFDWNEAETYVAEKEPYKVNFRSAVKKENSTWIMPQSARCIIEYDHLKNKITEYTDWFHIFDGYQLEANELFGKGILVKESLWLPCLQLNAIVEFNTHTKKGKLHFIGENDRRYTAIAYSKDCFWIIDNQKQVLTGWTPETGIVTNINAFPDEYEADDSDKNTLFNIFYMQPILNNYILLLPSHSNQFLLVDLKKQTISAVLKKRRGESYISAIWLNDSELLCLSHKSNRCILFSLKDRTFTEKEVYVDIEISSEPLFVKHGNMSLQNYIDYVKKLEHAKIQNRNQCGSIIYNKIKEGQKY